MAIQAVLTGDIVNSTKLTVARGRKLSEVIAGLFADHRFEFYRGDSFQAYLRQPDTALQLALLCRSAAIGIAREDKSVMSDVRISIGIGPVNTPVRSLKTAQGEAFTLSGRQFDEIAKSNTRLAISSANELANEGLAVIAGYINSIFDSMTGKQAEVVFLLLKGDSQQDVAKKLRKTKSTIHQRVSAARWQEIEKLLQQFQRIIKLLS